MKKILDWIGGICAFLTIAVFGILIIHANWPFIPDTVLNILAIVKTWAPLVVVAITGFEFTREKSITFKIIFYILMAIVIISMFFPNTWSEFVGFVNNN